jgi:uncharacterized protein YndB with AHSA1/START domain
MTMSSPRPPATRTIRSEIRTTAPPERVWEAWTDPEKLAQWFVDRAKGEVKQGSTYTWFFDDFGYEIPYPVVEVVPGERFALAGQLPGRPPFRLEISIAKEGGRTRVTLINSGFLEGSEWDEEYEGILSGWTNALAVLKHYVENHFGKPKTAILVLRPAVFHYEALLPYFTTSEGLARWLTSSGEIGVAGEGYALSLREGGTMTGRVLAITAREVAVSWNEVGGVFEFKAFSTGGGNRMVGGRCVAWSLPPGRAGEIKASMEKAFDRLSAELEKAAAMATSQQASPSPSGRG